MFLVGEIFAQVKYKIFFAVVYKTLEVRMYLGCVSVTYDLAILLF